MLPKGSDKIDDVLKQVDDIPYPQGFANAEEFAQFGEELNAGLRGAGYSDVQPLFQGSSVTGKSFKTGKPFDVGRVSDFDIALGSPKLLARAKELGIGLRSGGVRTGPLNPAELEKLGLLELVDKLSKQWGRKVSFMLYDSTDSALKRGAGITIP